jgi:hypothetical protein
MHLGQRIDASLLQPGEQHCGAADMVQCASGWNDVSHVCSQQIQLILCRTMSHYVTQSGETSSNFSEFSHSPIAMSNPALSARVDALLSVLNALQTRVDRLSATRSAARPAAMLTATTASPGYDLNGQDNELQQRLRSLCRTLGLHSSYFRRTPLDYYDRPLSFRKEFLGAPSEQYLCKSIICVNTHCTHDRFEQAHYSKYLLLVVQ